MAIEKGQFPGPHAENHFCPFPALRSKWISLSELAPTNGSLPAITLLLGFAFGEGYLPMLCPAAAEKTSVRFLPLFLAL
jgi:hypothetical protein